MFCCETTKLHPTLHQHEAKEITTELSVLGEQFLPSQETQFVNALFVSKSESHSQLIKNTEARGCWPTPSVFEELGMRLKNQLILQIGHLRQMKSHN